MSTSIPVTKRNTPGNRKTVLLLALFTGIAGLFSACSDDTPGRDFHRTWMNYGGGPDQSKYVKLDQIDKTNVDQLEVAWFYPTEDENNYQFNPIIVDDMMYVLAKNNSLVALDAATGEEIWIHANLRGIARRGMNYWESEDREDRRLIFQMNDYLQAIDARTGESIMSFGENGLVDLKEGLVPRDPETLSGVQSSMAGTVFEDLIIMGSATGENYLSAPGHIRAYNVRTGEMVWRFHTIPQPGEYGYETWPEEAYRYIGGTNVWSEMSVDTERGIGYFPTGSPTYDFYGADRIGQNLFGNTLIALDLRTGERIWHFQIIHHDLWDYDLAAAPQLITVNHDGEEIDAVAQSTKHGFLFVFNRETGEPLWPIEEREVPPSHMPGEEAWPTQPFPTVVPPFSSQRLTTEDISTVFLSDEEHEEWVEKIAELDSLGRTGLFTPMSNEYETLKVPGVLGGSNFGSTAANPEKGLVFIINIEWPGLYAPLEERSPQPEEEDESDEPSRPTNPIALGGYIYTQSCQMCHGQDLVGLGNTPSLIGMENRLSFEDFQYMLTTGRGEMPAFTELDEDELMAIYRYLGGSRDGAVVEPPSGPVVASGGVPGGQALRVARTSGGRLGAPYPESVDAPEQRFYIRDYGQAHPYIQSPPWSTLVAYDLNEGTIKWERPLGQDKLATEAGHEDTGVMRTQRKGMIVTSTGLLFSTAQDGKIYAFDQETGEELWAGELPTGTEGIPSMYEVDGRHYIVVTATTPLRWGRYNQPDENQNPDRGYVVFSLPEN